VDTVYEANLSNMSPDQLVAILTAVQRKYQSNTWRVDDAQLVFEISEELTRRGYPQSYLGQLLATHQ
jgi:hypothetical protein